MFRRGASNKFRLPQQRLDICSKLMRDGKFVTEKIEMLKMWEAHFERLARSNKDGLEGLWKEVEEMNRESCQKEDVILDVAFTAEEVEHTLARMKKKKAPGPDALMAEHLQEAGTEVQIWLRNVLNVIVDIEEIPSSMKSGIITPVYKHHGRDPLKTYSYKGVTISSVIAKLLELLLLNKMRDMLNDASIPHYNQSAYRKGISCSDAIFATQEVIARYVREGSKVHMCLYDLQKAFDSVEYPVLLRRLFEVGVNGKAWRLLKNWYEGAKCQVRLGGALSETFEIRRGVKQGLILAPTLFLLIMDLLLHQLEASENGLIVNNFYAGGCAHADDIRTLASSEESLEAQTSLVRNFCTANFLQLNVQKCEVITLDRQGGRSREGHDVDGVAIPGRSDAKCQGYWWNGDLFATAAVEEGIKKARRVFFQFDSIGCFQGALNPASSRSVIKTCVMPVLLYGCENWIMSESLLDKLDSFLGEIAKRALGWPKHHSNTAALVALDMMSARSELLIAKLRFLKRRTAKHDVIGGEAMRAFADDVNSLCLVKECRELEEVFGTSYTDVFLGGADLREVSDAVETCDKARLLKRCEKKFKLVAEIGKGIGWARLWDSVMDLGVKHIKGLQALSRIFSSHGRGSKPCPSCDATDLDGELLDHLLKNHLLYLNKDSINIMNDLQSTNLSFLRIFHNMYLF